MHTRVRVVVSGTVAASAQRFLPIPELGQVVSMSRVPLLAGEDLFLADNEWLIAIDLRELRVNFSRGARQVVYCAGLTHVVSERCMTHGCIHSHGRAVLLRLAWVVAAATASCVPSTRRGTDRADPGGGAGGGPETAASGSGGILGGGGNEASAGSEIAGSEAGGAGGTSGTGGPGGDSSRPSGGSSSSSGGGGGNGGTTGAGGALPASIRCTADADCTASGQVCEPATKLCVPCVKTGDCPSGGHCLGNRCVTFAPCSSKADCSAGQLCDPTRGVCVSCMVDKDCGAGRDCRANQCVVAAVCEYNSDCPTSACDTANNRCIDCVDDSNCGSIKKRCLLNVCRTICTSNADCSPLGMVCESSSGTCWQCVTNKDCPASWYCLMSVCVPDVCDATQSACSGTSVASCGSDGDVFDSYTSCAASRPCTVRGAVARCGGVADRDAGVSDARIATGDGRGRF